MLLKTKMGRGAFARSKDLRDTTATSRAMSSAGAQLACWDMLGNLNMGMILGKIVVSV